MFVLKKRKKFGEIAVSKGLIAERQLEQALAEQRDALSRGKTRKKIGTILLEKGFLKTEDIKNILEEQNKDTFWSLVGTFLSFKSGV